MKVLKALFILVLSILCFSCKKEDGQGGYETNQAPIEYEDTTLIETVDQKDENVELLYHVYRVKEGDMIGVIAETFNVTQDTLISVNSIKSSRLIQVGQYLRIPSMTGILYTTKKDGESINSVAEKYEISAEKCALVNKKETLETLPSGVTLFLPDAEMDWATRQEINGDLFRLPLHSSYYLSSYFGWRNSPFNTKVRSYHNGLDMACPKGVSIYAAMNGTVSSAGWSNVYGNYVIITHTAGYKTLYGHMSEILTSVGRRVTTDTRIGRVGSTGQSTGPHLHFTIYKNGKAVNPLGLMN